MESQGELTEKRLVFTPKFRLRYLAIHAHTAETGRCSSNVITGLQRRLRLKAKFRKIKILSFKRSNFGGFLALF